MSIYPVPLQKWFPHPRVGQHVYGNYGESANLHDTIKFLVKLARCENCGKHCKLNRAWGHHSLPWGYGEVFCSEKCLYGPKKRKKTARKKKVRGKIKKQWQAEFNNPIEHIENSLIAELKK